MTSIRLLCAVGRGMTSIRSIPHVRDDQCPTRYSWILWIWTAVQR